jgi:phosphoribosyl-ATP pyrophosphohydrolase
MQATAAQYRKFAEECEQLATAAQSERHRSVLREMADAWKKLAARADKSA